MVSLELKGLVKSWPGMTVSASFMVEAGTILAVAGPSGCGKSTMLRMAAGLCKPDSGSVIVGGHDVTAAEPHNRGIGMVFQDYALFPHLDVAGNVAYGLRPLRLGRSGIAERVKKLLAAVDLTGFELRKPHELSGGERQRVALARTLAVEPSVVLFDEPLSSLDATLRKRLRSDIVEEQRRLGFTAVYVTHDLEEAMAIGDSLAIMDDGRVLQCSAPRTVWSEPASVSVARFMGSGPCLPVLRLEQRDGVLTAMTAAGNFTLRGRDVPETCPTASRLHVFFERSAADQVPFSTSPAHEATNGSFNAACLRTDYAGDAVDCLMDSGGERFTLRFTRDAAPGAGSNNHYEVPAGSIRLLTGI
jgi:ABC-type Fe3+/spermidine/putrescine transport system ATPase subunit